MSTLAEINAYDEELLLAGDHKQSLLYQIISTQEGQKKPEMPKKGEALTEGELQLVATWIDSGATWPDGLVLREAAKADRTWWAYQPLVVSGALEDHTIDSFIQANLKNKGLSMNPPADPRQFIRRATYDLTGLPPSQSEVDDFTKAFLKPGHEDQAVKELI